MAKAGFGGSGDFSATFGSVYQYNKTAKRAQQDADDNDAYDKWANGIMSDDEWLAWIAGRIQTYAGDAKRQQQWVENQRKFTKSIADSRAVFNYEQGGSINQLISHFEGRLAELGSADSNEKRDLTTKLNELIDKRAGDDIELGSKALIEGINKGTKKYTDLLSFLQSKLAETRGNSDLRDQLTKQIDNVREQIRGNKVEGDLEKLQYQYEAGKLSAGSYAAKLRQMAVQFKDSDTKRYYQILEAANSIAKGGGGGGGGGGGRSGGGGGGGGSKAGKASLDAIKANDEILYALQLQYDEVGPGGQGMDPISGKPIFFNENTLRQMDEDRIKNYDKWAAVLFAKGDPDGAADKLGRKSTYIAKEVVAHNTTIHGEDTYHVIDGVNAAINKALASTDPEKGLADVRNQANNLMAYATHLNNKSKYVPDKGIDALKAGGDHVQAGVSQGQSVITGPKALKDMVDQGLVNEMVAKAQALQIISDPMSTPEALAAAFAALGTGDKVPLGNSGKVGSDAGMSVLELVTRVVDTKPGPNGEPPGKIRILDNDGIKYVPTTTVAVTNYVDGQAKPGYVTQPDVDLDGKTQRWETIFIDINGKPTAIKAIATKSAVQGLTTNIATQDYTDGNGKRIQAGTRLNAKQVAELVQRGMTDHFQRGPAVETWQVTVPKYTDGGKQKGGDTWYVDEQTGLWYKDALPIRGVQRDGDGVALNEDGTLKVDYKAYASAGGVGAIYSGTDNKTMQYIYDSGGVDMSNVLGGRDELGRFDPTKAPSSNGMYWDPVSNPFRDNWAEVEERDKRVKEAAFYDAAADVSENRWKNPASNPTGMKNTPPGKGFDISEAVGGMLKQFGLNLGMTEAKNAPVYAPAFHDSYKDDISSGPSTPYSLNLPKVSQSVPKAMPKAPRRVGAPVVKAKPPKKSYAPAPTSVDETGHPTGYGHGA